MKGLQYNDERLYQEIMRGLDKGVAEYDRLMACGDAPAKRKKSAAVSWYAVAASVSVLLIIGATLFVGRQDKGSQYKASTELMNRENVLETREAPVSQTVNKDSDLYRLTAKLEVLPGKEQHVVSPTPYENIYTAMLPEVEFCLDGNVVGNNDVRLPQVGEEHSFDLVCKVILPEVTSYADSTTIMYSTELTVACNEIYYND